MSEHSMILQLRYGNVQVLEKIYSEFRAAFINWMAHAYQCDREEALEIYQFVILTFYENVLEGKFDGSSSASIKTYLFSIGKNKMLAERRKGARFEEVKDTSDEKVIHFDFDAGTPNDPRLEVAKRVIEKVGNPCKQLLELFYFNNLDHEEIAVVMGYKNGNTVKNLKYKCVQRIRKLLRGDKGD